MPRFASATFPPTLDFRIKSVRLLFSRQINQSHRFLGGVFSFSQIIPLTRAALCDGVAD
jgi:hypothetical protein